MPTYVYKFVKTGETIEVQQSFDEDTLTAVVHPRSRRKMAVKKVFTPVGVTFRGDGFYKTDSRSKSTSDTKAKPESTTGDSGAGTKSDTKSEQSSSGSTTKKSEATASATS